jgi:hypothetical protein
MGRLTNHFDYCDFTECRHYDKELAKKDNCNFIHSSRNQCLEYVVYNKLREYEDLEEQLLKSAEIDIKSMVGEFMYYYNLKKENRLLELPCKVGDTVWCIEECEEYEDYEDRFEISGYVFMSMCGEYCFVSAHFIHCNDIEEQLEDMVEECENWGSVDVGIFHKNKVFLAKEEAEKALAEITEFKKNSEKEVKTEAILAEMGK